VKVKKDPPKALPAEQQILNRLAGIDDTLKEILKAIREQ